MKIRLSVCIVILTLCGSMKMMGQHESLGELEWISGNWIRKNSRVEQQIPIIKNCLLEQTSLPWYMKQTYDAFCCLNLITAYADI